MKNFVNYIGSKILKAKIQKEGFVAEFPVNTG